MHSPFSKLFFAIFLIALFTSPLYSQFAVNTGVTALQMAQELVGPGVEVISASYVGNANAKGIFSATGTSLPIENGVVLSTGKVTDINKSASSQASTGFSNASTPDSDLDNILSGTKKDLAYLEFQFKAIGTQINFEFVFGSEEYPEYNCSPYNDVFGFFLSGPGITGKENLALVPGTNIPVTINSINSGTPGGGYNIATCQAMGSGSPFTQYYINNSSSTTIVYDGLTTTLTATHDIQSCEIYTIKLAIADLADNAYDSGVFIKSNSFQTEVPTLSIESNPTLPVCPVDEITFTSILTGAQPPITYNWLVNGVGQNVDADQITISGLQDGDEVLLVVNADINCSGDKLKSNTITIDFLPYGMEDSNVTICEGESYTFNGITYTQSVSGVTDTIPDPPNCPKIITLNLTVTPATLPEFSDYGPYCQGDTPPPLPSTSNNGIAGTWTPATINTSAPGTSTYTFTPNSGICASVATIDIVVDAPITPSFNQLGPFCQGDTPPSLPGSSNDSPAISGTWNPAVINTSTPGTFTYTFTPDAGFCASTTTMDIVINAPTVPTFDPIGPLCQNSSAPTLPTSSTDNPAITGKWNPSSINTSTPGTFTFNFTPNPGQCAAPTTMTITIEPKVVPTFDQLGPYCKDEAPDVLPGTSTNSPGITGTWNPAVINTSVAGTFTYTFTPDAGICAEQTTMTIVIDPPILPTFDQLGPYCKDDAPDVLPGTSTNSPGITGTWNPAVINTSVAGTFTYTFTPDASFCALPTTMDITINEPTTPSFTPIGPLCQNSAAPTLPTTSNDSPGIQGTWSPSVIDMSTPGIFTFTFTPLASECALPTTLDIEIVPRIQPTFNPLGPYCKGDTPDDLPTSSTNTPSISGTWNPSVINTSTPGTFTYIFTPDAGICAETATLTIVIDPPVIPTFDQLGPYCKDESPDILPSTSNNIPSFTGTWNPAVINTSTPGTFTYTFTPDAGQCADPTTMDIVIDPPVTPTFDPIAPLCQNSVPIVLPGTSNNTPPISGTWSPAIVNTSTPGTFTYTFTPDAGICAIPTTLEVTINEPKIPVFDAIGPLCQYDNAPTLPSASNNSPAIKGTWNPAIIDMSTPGIFTYTFTPIPSECATPITMDIEILPKVQPTFDPLGPYCKGDTPDILPGTSTNTPPISGSWNPAVINTSTPGTFTYTFTPDAGICAETATMTITIEKPAIPTFDPLGPYCMGDTPDILPGTSTNNPTITGSWNPAVINTSTPGTFTFTFTPDAGQCADIFSMDITINKPIQPSFAPVDPLCLNDTPIVLPETSTDSPPIKGSWSPFPVSTFPAGVTTYTFTPDVGQCATETTLDITVNEPIVTTFSQIDPLCQYSVPPTLPNSSSNNPPVFGSWSPSTINTSVPGTFTYTFNPNPDECATSFMMDIEIKPQIMPIFSQLGPYCLNDVPDILNTSSENIPAITGTWTPSVINTSVAGTFDYVFTPDPQFCSAPYTMSITVENPSTPLFNPIDPICQNTLPPDLPLQSNDIPPVTGSWSPAVINTSSTGPSVYTFSPDPGFCMSPTTLTVIIYDPPLASFNQLGPYCLNSAGETLPLISNDNPPVSGTWNPAVVNTSVVGTQTYTFTPDPNQCAKVTTMDITIIDPIVTTFNQLGPYCYGVIPDILPQTSSNNPPVSGTWSPTVINTSQPGITTYTFTPFSTECATPFEMNIEVKPLPEIVIQPVQPICKDSAAVVLAATPAGGTWSGTNVSGNIFTPSSVGQFTVFYTYTDASGCTNLSSINVVVNDCSCQNPASVNAGPDGSVCVGGVYNLSGQVWVATDIIWSTSGSGTFGNNSDLNTTYTPSTADIASGSVVLTLTTVDHDGSGPCSTVSDQMILTITNTPITIQPIDPLCSNDSPVTLNATPTPGVWSGPGITGGLFDPTSAGPGQHILTYTLTGGCTGSSATTITVNQAPIVSVEPIDTLCMDDPAITLTGTPAGGIFSGPGVTGNTFTPTVPGNFPVQYLFTDSNQCNGIASISIPVINCNCENPVTVNAGPDLVFCTTGAQSITGTVSNASVYHWETSGTGTFGNADALSTTYTPSAADVASGSVILTLTGYDPDGNGPCQEASDFTTITFEVINITIDPVNPLCLNGAPKTLNASPPGGIFSGNGITGNNFDPAIAGTGTHTITYSVSGNCPASKTINIIVNPLPVITLTPLGEICLNDPSVELIGSPAGGVWSGTNVSGNQFNPVTAGSFILTYTYTNANGCTNSKNLTVAVKDCACANPATADAGDDAIVCNGNNYTLSGTITVAGSAQWSTSGSGAFDDINNLQATYTPSNADINAGSVTLTLTTDDPDGDGPCSAVSDALTLTFESTDIILTPQAPLCIDALPVTLTATPPGGNWSGPGITGNTFNPATAGVGSHKVTYNIGGNCPDSEAMFIVVNPLPLIEIFAIDTLCAGDDAITLSASPSGGTWSGINVSGNQFNPASPGTYTITYSYSDLNGCSAQQSISIIVNDCGCANPVIVNAGNDQNICAGDEVTLQATVQNAANITWSTSGDGIFNNPNDNPCHYIPGPMDISSGSVKITATSEDPDGTGPCFAAIDELIINITQTIISFPQINPLCVNAGSIILNATPPGGVFSGTGVNNNSFDPGVAGPGNHVINYHIDGNCPSDKTITITVNPLPQPIISPVSELCLNDEPVILEASPAGGTFSGDHVSNGIFIPSEAGTFVITYTMSDNNGCTGSTIVSITVKDCGCTDPVTVDAGNNLTICSTETVPLNGNISGGISGKWTTSGDGNFTDPNALLTVYTPGPNDIINGSVKLTLKSDDPDGNGPCSAASSSVIITITELIIKINPVPNLCIDGQAVTLSASPSGGIFSGPGINGNIFDPASAGVGTHTITYTVSGNCPGQQQIQINVNPLPAISINPVPELCINDPAFTLSASPTGGVFTGLGVTGNTFNPAQVGIFTIEYTYTDPNGCSNSSIIDIKVKDCGCADPAAADAGPDQTVCEGDIIQLSGSITNAPGSIWSSQGTGIFGDDNLLQTTYIPSLADIVKGSVIITLTTIDSDGSGPCNPISDQILIKITPKPIVKIVTSPSELCLDELPINLVATPLGGTWSGPGIVNTNSFDPAKAGVGSHTLIYSYFNGNCKGEATLIIYVKDCSCNTVVTVDAGPDKQICSENSIIIQGSVTGSSQIEWTTDGTGTFSDKFSPVTEYFPSDADRQKQQVTLTITSPDPDGDGPCVATSDQLVLTITTLLEINLLIENTDCQQQVGSVTILPPASDRYIFSVDSGITFSGLPYFGDLQPGNYNLIFKDPQSGCQSTKDFTINPPPYVNAKWNIVSKACTNAESNYIDIIQTENMVYPLEIYLDSLLWTTTSTLPLKIDQLEAGSHHLSIIDSKGCKVEGSFEIKASSDINIDIQGVYVVNEGESATLIPVINSPYSSITWKPADYLSCTDCPTPTTKPEKGITYNVVVTDNQGCQDSISVRVVIRRDIKIFVPNVFTPNGDGVNDFVTVFTDHHIKKIDNLKIFTRWGELVFEKSDLLPNIEAEGWDGKFRGQKMNPAVFAWVAEINIPGEGVRIFKGDVTLIR
ncbi:MAG: choice-of-anchor L domain-containing protein [Saprospiraceae bacterium]|nr:choice-of-anchor L domain-containing protein [Saprospiraceae bacterium]